ncbi:hypothetical protein MKW92_000496 [Papaver armeniacum]|nr:hypothetical protein MKW92_000496 [Papaver armeniacum]
MGKSSKRSDTAAASQFVSSGEGNKRVAEEELKKKPFLKRNKFDKSTNRETSIGPAAPAKKKDELEDEPVKSTGASKTLIATNLSFSIDKSHVINFFKQVGDIVDVQCHFHRVRNGKTRVHSGHIEFATEEAAKKAVNLHDEFLLGHRVKLFPQLEGTGASKTLFMNDLPFYTDKSDVIKFFKQVGEIVDVRFSYGKDGKFSQSAHIEFATEEAAAKAVRLGGLDLLGSLVGLRRLAQGIGASKTLCLKNLPYHINKSDVINFFEKVGDIADVRFSCDKYKTFKRVAHVEFATEEAAKEAAKWNGRHLLGRPVHLGIVRETLCVQGLDTSLELDQIWRFLENHFQTCGSIVHVDIPENRYTGVYTDVPLGSVLIEFSSLQAFHRALDLDGREVDGSSLTITDYVPVYLNVRGTGGRHRFRNGFGQYSGSGYGNTYLSSRGSRGYDGAGLGKNGISHYPPPG